MSDIRTRIEKDDSRPNIGRGLSPSEKFRRDYREAEVRRVANEYIQAASEYQISAKDRGWPNHKINEEGYHQIIDYINSAVTHKLVDQGIGNRALTQLGSETRSAQI